MELKQKTYYLSLIILLVCILLAILIYRFTGSLVIAIFFAPPIIHWILRKREEKK